MKRILCTLLFAAPLLGQTVTGKFAAGEQYVEPERNAPAATSRMFVRANNGQGVDLPATGQGGMIIVINGRTAKSARLRTPAGDGSSDTLQRFAVDDQGNEVLHITSTIAGRYHVSDAGTSVVAAEPESLLTMTTTVGPLSRMPGEPLTLHATLRDGDEVVSGARVFAHLTAPRATDGDAIALEDRGNGEYEAVITDLPLHVNGFWNVRYDADGVTAHGVEFARTGSNQFMNERISARLGRIHSRVENGVLHVTADAKVMVTGHYRFDVIVASRRDANGARQGVAWGESAQLLECGAKELSIDIPLDGAPAADLFLDVRLLNLDSMGMAGRQTIGD